MNNFKSLSLEQKIEKCRARPFEACPKSSKRLLNSCWAERSSLRQAIKAFCVECVGYDRDAAVRCTAYACPLWAYRPHQKKASP